ncbi:unnamed protein product [Arabidopsis thaliana]|uniref:(thale cress) hypothetical protein n=1 Tax=Arabidopsis thaliana TaxID=3702 RepID=A0A7G2DXZ5_ARATH|nr:unnamed protein product [Arabidopsis thaliana]
MPSDNTYVRFRQQQRDPLHVNSPVSAGNISGVQGSGSRHPPSPPTPTTQPSVNHSDAQAERLNNLTLDELLDSPGRAGLTRLDPKRPPATLWFDDDSTVAATVRSIFERDFKEPHANWSQTSKATIDRCVTVEGNWKEKGDEAKPKWIDPEKVTSRIEEEESHMCSGDNPESTGSCGLSVHAKNKIFAEVAPRKKGRIYGVGSLQFEAFSAHSGSTLPSDDPVILSQKLAAAEAYIQSQAEKINSFDILFDYLADKDPALAAILRRGSSTQTGPASANEAPVATAPEQQVANEETAAATLANLATRSSPSSIF